MKKLLSILLALVCTFTTILTTSTIVFANEQNILYTNVCEEIFDGYENIETTTSGKVGFNYVIEIPNTNKDLRLGFNPYNLSEDCYVNELYNIGLGWQYKLSNIQINENKITIYKSSGYTYDVKNSNEKYEIIDYPVEHTLLFENNMYILEEAYGVKEYFSAEGTLIKSIDEFGAVTEYKYNSNGLQTIKYSDGTWLDFEYSFDEKSDVIRIYYVDIMKKTLVGTLVVNTEKDRTLSQISSSNGFTVDFDYLVENDNVKITNYSIEGKYNRDIVYTDDSILKTITYYNDSTVEESKYLYNQVGRISKIIDGTDAQIEYSYIADANNDITIETKKTYMGQTSRDAETINKYGQTTEYISQSGTISLKYYNNKVIEEKTNDLTIKYDYNDNGLVETATTGNGERLSYSYSKDGCLQKIVSSDKGVLFNENTSSINTSSIMPFASTGSTVKVISKIGSNIGVTNWHTVYKKSVTSFNCYTYAIGMAHDTQPRNPGYYSKNNWTASSNITLDKMQLLTKKDEEALGRKIYDSTVNGTFNAHSWIIALRVRQNVDYHFMSKSYGTSSPWKFKAGVSNPVMHVLNGKNPSQITWDTYTPKLGTGTWQVKNSSFYNSGTKYMIIRD